MSATTNNDTLNVNIMLGVDDKTRHHLYLRNRNPTEIKKSKHKETVGGGSVSKNVNIHNGRGKQLKLDDASFELIDCPTALSTADFYKIQGGNQELQQQYYDEVAAQVQAILGCDKVVCFHSQVRNASKQNDGSGVQGYAGLAPHTDASAVTGDETALLFVEGDTTYKRYAYLNLWRNISDNPIQQHHLAMVDERSTVKPDDYITRDVYGIGFTAVQYSLNARHADLHKWYYYPGMTKQEGILFKQMDSDWRNTGRICFHMSVEDPNKDANLPRESIEVRMVCYWKEAQVDSMPTPENTNSKLIKDLDELAMNNGPSLQSASFLDLTWALMGKVPLIGSLLGASGKSKSSYTGDPQDYVEKFVMGVKNFPSWPSFAVGWVKGEMKKAGSAEKGIANITKAIVDDQFNYQGTKYFEPAQKKEIVNLLLKTDSYMEYANKYWAPYVTE